MTTKSWMAAGSLAMALLAASPEAGHAQSVIGNGLAGAGVGAAIGAIAGGGRGAATGAIIGGAVGAGSAIAAPRPYYAPRYRHYVRGCGPYRRWIPGHHNHWGQWRPGHCS